MINKYTKGFTEKEGIFFSKTKSDVSYPEEGNEVCFQIEENSFWFSHRNNCIIESYKKYCPERVFFDIGGGNGFVAKGLQDIGVNTVLLEPGMIGCENAKKRGLKNIICSTLENSEFEKSSIPSIGLFDVVEHIENDVNFLTSIHYYLEEGGYVFITVPAYNFLWSQEDIIAGHYRRYTLRQINAKLKNLGFEIVHSTYFFSVLPFPIFLSRSIPFLLRLKKKGNHNARAINDHSKKSFSEKVLNIIWTSEIKRIKLGRKIRFGGSCLVVAQKN
jgi:hypothetical protein